jgi:hypothetical protein
MRPRLVGGAVEADLAIRLYVTGHTVMGYDLKRCVMESITSRRGA